MNDCEACGGPNASRRALCPRCAVIVRLVAGEVEILGALVCWLRPRIERRREAMLREVETALASGTYLARGQS